MKKLIFGIFVLTIGTAMIFAGGSSQGNGSAASGGSGASGTTVIRWAFWGNEERIQLSQQAVDVYEAANPGVKVNIEPSGGTGDHFNKVDTQLAGGNGPDIIQMGGNFPDYVNRNVILALDAYAGKGLNTAVIDAGSLDAGKINGKLYGITTGITVPALIYNKTMLEKAGLPLPPPSSTYDEFRSYLVSLKSKLPSGVWPMMDFGVTSSSTTPFGYWLRYNGTPIYDDVTNTTKVQPQDAQKYLELFKDYRDNGLVPPADVAASYPETSSDTSALVAGKVAITFTVSNQLPSFQAAMTDEVGLIEPPGAATNKALWPQLSQVMTVNKDSKNIEAAVKFIDFIINSPDAAKILGNNRGSSASSTYRAGLSANKDDQKINDYHALAGPHTSPETAHLPNDTELNSTAYLVYQQVAFGRLTPAQGGQQIYDLLVRLIGKK